MRTTSWIRPGRSENPFGLSISDLMAVLLLFFVLLTAAALLQLGENTVQSKIFSLIKKELNQVNIKAEINPEHGTITIADEILFEKEDWRLTEEGRAFLDRFVPILERVLFFSEDITNEVVSVDIEGYASQDRHDREFERWMMRLSLDRARSVWEYIQSMEDLEHRAEFLKKLKVCGWGNMKAKHVEDDPSERKVVFQLQFKGQFEKLKESFRRIRG